MTVVGDGVRDARCDVEVRSGRLVGGDGFHNVKALVPCTEPCVRVKFSKQDRDVNYTEPRSLGAQAVMTGMCRESARTRKNKKLGIQ
jgi:hypothetical protein